MIQELPDQVSNFYEHYQLELTWLVIAIWAIRSALEYLRKKRSKDYVRIKKDDALILPLKPDINWPMIILTVVFTIAGFIIFIVDLSNDTVTRDTWYMLGLVITLLISGVALSLRKLSLKLTLDEIILNEIQYKASEIRKVELWDDLIYVVLKNNQKEKIWLRFRAKHYKTALEVIESIDQFCQKRGIPIQNQFATDILKNEVFNPDPVK